MRNMVYPASIGDDFVPGTIDYAWKKYGMFIDPHTAVALAAAQQVGAAHKWSGHAHTVVLATGHPAKEAGLLRKATGQNISIPESLSALRKKTDPIAVIQPQLDAFEGAIASCF